MGGTERFMRAAEQDYGATFRIAAVLTLASATPLHAGDLTAAVAAVAARHEALRTLVVGDTFVEAPPHLAPCVDVAVVPPASMAAGVTAAAFAAAQAVLAGGVGGVWANPPPTTPGGVPATLPWRAGVFLPPPGTPHNRTDAGALVWYTPHYLTDGTSTDALAAATVDALAAAAAAAAGGASPPPHPPAVVPLAPPLGAVYPPPGGALGVPLGMARLVVKEVLTPLTARHRRPLVAPRGPPAKPAERSGTAHDALVPAAVVRRFAAAAKAAGTTVGCALVAAAAAALDAGGVVAPAAAGRRSTVAIDVPINARVGAPAGSGLHPTTVGCYVGSAVVDVPVTAATANDLWPAAVAVFDTIHTAGFRRFQAESFGVLGELLSSAPGRSMLGAKVASPSEQGRLMPPGVSNVGRYTLTDAANDRVAAGGGGSPTVTAVRLLDWEATMGASLILYACTVGGDMALVLTTVQPLVSTAAAEAVLAEVVRHIEAAA